MIFNYNNNSKSSGVYQITNTHTNRIYIGQAKEFKSRWRAHKSALLTKKCRNKFMQSDFNKCFTELGHDDFLVFSILQVMDGLTKKERDNKEEEFIALFHDKQMQCYNMQTKATPAPSTFSHTPEETRAKRSAVQKGRKHSEETKKRMSEVAKGRKGLPLTEVQLEKMRQGAKKAAKRVTLIDPKGEPVFIENVNDWCKEKGYRSAHFYAMIIGNVRSIYGYTMPDTAPKRKAESITLVNPQGELIVIDNLKVWCKKNGFSSSHMYAFKNGKYKHAYGYTLPATTSTIDSNQNQ